jgi:hypothetical protein
MLEFPLLQGNIGEYHLDFSIIPRPDLSASHGLLRNLYLLRLKGNSLATAWKNNNQCISRKEGKRKVVV